MNCTSKDAYASIFKWDNHMPERNTDSLKHRTVKTAVCFRSTTTPRQKRSQDKDRAQRINKVFAEKPQKSSLDGSGVWGKMDTWMCMAEWLCWLKLILLIDYTLIKKKKSSSSGEWERTHSSGEIQSKAKPTWNWNSHYLFTRSN